MRSTSAPLASVTVPTCTRGTGPAAAREGPPASAFQRLQTLNERITNERVGEVDAGAVVAVGPEDLPRQHDGGIALRLQLLELGDGIAHQLV
jgi:hypothetical protein